MKKIICLLLIACLLLVGCNQYKQPALETIDPGYEAQQPTLSPTEPEDPDAILAYRRDVV